MSDVFVSYAREDSAFVGELVQVLSNAGFSVWWDRSLEPGVQWAGVIDRELRRCRCVLVVWSRHSVDSHWVNIEANEARRRGVLIPVVIEPVQLGEEFAGMQRLDWPSFEDSAQAAELVVERVRRHTRRRKRTYAGLVLSACAAILLAWVGYTNWYTPVDENMALAGHPSPQSIAVLRFTEQPEMQAAGLADGISLDLINELARVPDLRVAARVASWTSTGSPLEKIRERLQVAWLLEGDVGTNAGDIEVRVRLVNAQTGFLHGSWSVLAPQDELLRLRGTLIEQITDALPGSYQARPDDADASVDGDAYRFYLQANTLLRDGRGTEDRVRAEGYLHQALEIDPEFAQALAGLCVARIWRHAANGDPDELVLAGQHCADAQQRAPEDSDVLLSQAQLDSALGNHEQAIAGLRSLLDGDPANSDARLELARALAAVKRPKDAEAQFRRVLSEQPGLWLANNEFASFLLQQGRAEEASRQFVRALDLAPMDPNALSNLGGALLIAGDLPSAIRAFQRSLTLGETAVALSNLATAYYYSERLPEAVTLFERAVAMQPTQFRLWSNLADARAALDDPAAAEAYQETERLVLEQLKVQDSDTTLRLGLQAVRAALGTGNLEALNQVLADAPDQWEISFFAALAYSRLGDAARARVRLKQAVALGFPEALARRDPLLGALYED